MGFVWWIVFGLIVGALAKLFMPGKQGGGFVLTCVLGILGAIVGGFLATQLGIGSITGFNLKSLAIAIGGAVLVIFLFEMFQKKR